MIIGQLFWKIWQKHASFAGLICANVTNLVLCFVFVGGAFLFELIFSFFSVSSWKKFPFVFVLVERKNFHFISLVLVGLSLRLRTLSFQLGVLVSSAVVLVAHPVGRKQDTVSADPCHCLAVTKTRPPDYWIHVLLITGNTSSWLQWNRSSWLQLWKGVD